MTDLSHYRVGPTKTSDYRDAAGNVIKVERINDR